MTTPSGQSWHSTSTSSLLASGSFIPVPCLCQDPCGPVPLTLVLTLLLAVPSQRHGTPAAREEGQGGCHQPVHDAALPRAQLQAPVWGGRGALSMPPSPQAPAPAPAPQPPARKEQPCSGARACVWPQECPKLGRAGERSPLSCMAGRGRTKGCVGAGMGGQLGAHRTALQHDDNAVPMPRRRPSCSAPTGSGTRSAGVQSC